MVSRDCPQRPSNGKFYFAIPIQPTFVCSRGARRCCGQIVSKLGFARKNVRHQALNPDYPRHSETFSISACISISITASVPNPHGPPSQFVCIDASATTFALCYHREYPSKAFRYKAHGSPGVFGVCLVSLSCGTSQHPHTGGNFIYQISHPYFRHSIPTEWLVNRIGQSECTI